MKKKFRPIVYIDDLKGRGGQRNLMAVKQMNSGSTQKTFVDSESLVRI